VTKQARAEVVESAAAGEAPAQMALEGIALVDEAPEETDLPEVMTPDGAVNVAADLSVGRGVIGEVARLAALEVPDVLRVARRGPRWRAALAGPPVMVRVRPEGVIVRLRIIARPGADLAETGRRVREAVGRAVERMLGLRVEEVSVLIDGVGS
jgi:uncharacterized alkaline shock family protein YloU